MPSCSYTPDPGHCCPDSGRPRDTLGQGRVAVMVSDEDCRVRPDPFQCPLPAVSAAVPQGVQHDCAELWMLWHHYAESSIWNTRVFFPGTQDPTMRAVECVSLGLLLMVEHLSVTEWVPLFSQLGKAQTNSLAGMLFRTPQRIHFLMLSLGAAIPTSTSPTLRRAGRMAWPLTP